VFQRLSRHGPAPEGDRRHGRDRNPHGHWRRRTRNIAGNNRPVVKLEDELADLHRKEAARIFTSGYVSNETVISTPAKLMPNCLILSDTWNHNSMRSVNLTIWNKPTPSTAYTHILLLVLFCSL